LDWKLPVRHPAEMALSGYFLLDNADDSQTPLQKKLAQLGKYLGVLALAACGIIFVVGLVNGIPPLEIFMTAVSLAVSAIPEGLPAILLCLVGGAVAGGLWSLISGLLKVYRGQNEMIITIMLNYVATLFMGVVYTDWLRDGSVPQTQAVPEATQLSRLFGLRVTSAFVIALAVGLLVYYFLFYTSKGFQLRAVGLNMTAAEFNGFAVKKYILMSFIVSGAIAGLGGSAELLGTQFRLINGFGNGYGFDGVAMALIGQLHPLATIVVAIFFAALRVGSTTMQAATGVPTSVSDIIQALVIVFTVAGLAMVKLPGFKAFLGRLTERRKEAA